MSGSALEQLQLDAPDAMELAELASIAARIDRVVLRALRIGLLPAADATAESDLWFSDIVARRGSDAIVLHSDPLLALRVRLAASDRLQAASKILQRAHADAPPLLALEEDLIYLGLTGASTAEIEYRLGEVLATINSHKDRRRDIAGWALQALPRLPESVRATTAAWSLAFAAESALGYTITLGDNPPAGALFLDADIPSVLLAVGPTENGLLLGGAEGPTLAVPATTPRIVTIESAADRWVAAIEPGHPYFFELPVGEAVLTNLRGARWRVRTIASEESLARRLEPTAPANGRWILIDGIEQAVLPLRYRDYAQQLGASLAQAGFSLVTMGTRGVASATAQAFWQILAAQGYPTGRVRLLHVVGTDKRPDFDASGRVLPVAAKDQISAAVSRADAVLLLGASGVSRDLADAAFFGGVPLAALMDQPVTRASTTLRLPLEPTEWDSESLARHCTEIARLLGDYLHVEQQSDPILQKLFHEAALVLDAAEFSEFEAGLNRLAKALPPVVPRELEQTLSYGRRQPWIRLLGYLSAGIAPVNALLNALQRERSTVQWLQEIRTLWMVLAVVQRTASSGIPKIDGSQERALAALCASIRSALDALPQDDIHTRCQHLLSAIAKANPASHRAEVLAQQAARYVSLRENTKSSDERTATLDELVDQIAIDYVTAPAMPEAEMWWGSGAAGQRLVALGLLLGAPDPLGFPLIEATIGHPCSSFEQYTALRTAQASLAQMSSTQLSLLRDSLRQQQSGPHATIKKSDRARWSLSEAILHHINGQLPNTASDAATQRHAHGSPVLRPPASVDRPIMSDLPHTDEAKVWFERDLKISEKLALADANDAQAQRDLSISLNKQGDVAVQMGQLSEAKVWFERSLKISEKLALADANDAQAQRDLSISLEKLGDVAVQMGQLGEAKVWFERSLKISEKLALADANDAQAQRDLSISLNKLGEVAVKMGQLGEAKVWFERDLKISEKLALADANDAQAQRDLSISLIGWAMWR
jgi:tetratricopeptide (TPR) repeat protein